MAVPITEAEPVIRPGTHTPFTTSMADDLGIGRRELYSSRYRSVLRGVYVDRRIPDSLVVRARAGLLVAPPGGILSHFTAACLWSATAARSSRIHVAYRTERRVNRPEIAVHRFSYPLQWSGRHGLPVTSPGMTFMHLAVHLDLVHLTAFGDQLVKRQVTTVAELQSYARAWTNHGYRAGREAAALVRDRVDSVPESHLRLLIVLAGLPEPTANLWVHDDAGVPTYRLDLAYPEIHIAVEYDGRWHDTPEQRGQDEVRRSWLRRRGWVVIVVKAEGLYQQPDETLSEIATALRWRGIDPGSRREEYRRYFGQVLSL